MRYDMSKYKEESHTSAIHKNPPCEGMVSWVLYSQRARTSSFWESWINEQVTCVGCSQRMSPQLPIHPIHQVTISYSLWGKNMLLSLGKDAIRQRLVCPCTNLHKCVDIGKHVNVRLSSSSLSHGKNTTPSAAQHHYCFPFWLALVLLQEHFLHWYFPLLWRPLSFPWGLLYLPCVFSIKAASASVVKTHLFLSRSHSLLPCHSFPRLSVAIHFKFSVTLLHCQRKAAHYFWDKRQGQRDRRW